MFVPVMGRIGRASGGVDPSNNPVSSFSAERSGLPSEKKTSRTTGTGSGCTLHAAPPATGDRPLDQKPHGPRYDSYLDVGRRKTDVSTANCGNIAGETGLICS